MKCEIIIDKECNTEKVVIFAKQRSELIDRIENLVQKSDTKIVGYKEQEITLLEPKNITCILVEGGRVFALCDNDKFLLKERLYTIESKLDNSFVKINQSCLANIRKILKFETSIGASLMVKFKNGYCDYVSRRQLRVVKERLGIKK